MQIQSHHSNQRTFCRALHGMEEFAINTVLKEVLGPSDCQRILLNVELLIVMHSYSFFFFLSANGFACLFIWCVCGGISIENWWLGFVLEFNLKMLEDKKICIVIHSTHMACKITLGHFVA